MTKKATTLLKENTWLRIGIIDRLIKHRKELDGTKNNYFEFVLWARTGVIVHFTVYNKCTAHYDTVFQKKLTYRFTMAFRIEELIDIDEVLYMASIDVVKQYELECILKLLFAEYHQFVYDILCNIRNTCIDSPEIECIGYQ